MTANDTPRRLPGRAATCRDCRQPIVFALTDKGRKMPLDPITDSNGNVLVTVLSGWLSCRVLTRDIDPEPWEPVAMPHFKTCTGRRPLRSRNRPTDQAQLAIEEDAT